MPIARSRTVHAIALLLALLVIATGSARAEGTEGNPLEPSPHATPEEAVRHASTRTAEASPAEAADVVGALTRLRDGRFGFMPLLQHHMAVEHWFVTGVDTAALAKAFAGTNRCFVRLRGQLTLLGIFGGSGLEWYGNGLEHGRDWGPVMGYHERVYRLEVEDVVWARDRASYLKHRAEQQTAAKAAQALLGELRYQEAKETLHQAVEGHRDAGIDVRGLEQLEQHAAMMTVLLSDPASWGVAEKDVVVQALLREPSLPFRELKKGATERLRQLIEAWPEAVHEEFGPRVVEGWMNVEYRHVRDGLRPVVAALRGDAVEAWKEKVEEAKARVEEAKQKLGALAGTGGYAEMLAVLEAARPYQAVMLDYALGDDRTKFWVPAARRLAALTAAWDEPSARMDLLLAQVQETIGSRSGLPNSSVKPRYNEELGSRFAPRLSEAEKERVETLLLEIAEPLNRKDHWQEILLVGELLSVFGAERAQVFFPTLLRRSGASPKWQRDHLHAFAEKLGVK